MNLRICLLPALALFACSSLHADEASFTVPKNSVKVGIAITVPENAKILKIVAKSDTDVKLGLYLKDDEDFDTAMALGSQALYFSNNNGGDASLAIGTYASPPLHQGTWHVALANYSQTTAAKITLTTSISDTAEVATDFEINFAAAPAALEDAFGGADNLECDVAPWSDATKIVVSGSATTLGAFRQSLLQSALSELSTQIHSPVPVHVQACWRKFDDSGEHAGSYTLAAAQGTYLFRGDAGMPLDDTWYAMAPAERLAGRRNCKYYADVDCSIPEIIVWYNSADIAKHSYDGPEDEALIRSVTMHEITHGLGFLSYLDISEKKDDGTDDPDFLKLNDGYSDAYTANVGFLSSPPTSDAYRVIPLRSLSQDNRKDALTSGTRLVWTDTTLADNPENILDSRPAPENLVELHAPGTIQPGSTLSHLSAVHSGQLMTAVIQSNFPQTLGLAGPMLARAGWNTTPMDFRSPYDDPISGNWYDPDHSGHGIELERVARDPAGDKYAIIFYTFDQTGNSEYYVIPSRLKNGHMGSFDDPAQPAAVGRPIYDRSLHKETYPDGPVGTMQIDFTPAAAKSPACADHTSTQLAVMNWSIGGESGSWCISPALGLAGHPPIDEDLNGFWNAGTSDSGWGFAVIETSDETGSSLNTGLLYYFDNLNQPRWVQVDPGQSGNNAYEPHGYCRTCAKEKLTGTAIGSMRFDLSSPEHVELPSGSNKVTIDIGKYNFKRSGTAVRMYSIPSGQ